MPRPNKSEKPNNTKRALKMFFRSIGKYRIAIFVAILLAAGSAVLGIFSPKLLGNMTNIAVTTYPEIDFGEILKVVWLIIGLFVGASVLNYVQGYILAVVTAKYTKELRARIIDKINRLPVSYFDNHKYGDVLSRMTNDVDVLATSLSQEITDLVGYMTTLIGVMIIMLTISVPLSMIAFIMVPLAGIVISQVVKFAQKYFVSRQNILGELDGRIEEDYAGEIVIKSNSREELAMQEFGEINQKLTTATRKSQIFSSLAYPITHVLTNIGYVAVCALGGVFVVEGRINIGDIQAFIQYVSSFNRPITELANTMATIQSLLASSERIFDFLAEPEEEPDPEPALTIDDIKGAVAFHNVCFGYNDKELIIKNFSVKVQPGMKVAIVGPTGAGKTTLINLLMRFYEPKSGYITIDGVPIREMKREDVRKLFGMVLQDTWLFNGSVEDNLRYGNLHASHDEIVKAAKASNVNHVIEALPKAYGSEISEDSDNISAGEKQLITIARAMVANPPMMILDEATSNVDTRTEQMIQDSLEKLTRNRTSFVIAHRLSTIRNSDLILVMKNGMIVEQGTHEQLLRKRGFYAELYNSQFAEN